jgi:hypothetical protein
MKQVSPRIIMHSISRKGFNFMQASRENYQIIISIGQIRTGFNTPKEREERRKVRRVTKYPPEWE